MAEVASLVVPKVVESIFGVVKKEISYMWYYTQNVENFRKALRDLKDMRGRVQQKIDIAKSEGKNLIDGVEKWVADADEKISKAEEFLQQEADAKKTCFKIGMCGNWATLHRYGKKATNMTPPLSQHQASGTAYEGDVSVYTPAPGPLDVFESKDLDGIDTHNSALNDIIAALEDESKQIIGIYGLGGVGKTTLAMEVAARVKTGLFADVSFITVSQTVNVDKIKNDTENASRRIMKGDKILIILDDVWETLNLQELCIPCGSRHKNCKILLTSRSQDVCEKMNAQSKVCVNSLPTKEAWILFKRVAGERVETDAELKPVAEQVATECGGLPLLIQVVGSTLKNKSISSWNSALSRLKKPAPSEIDPDIRKAFTRLQLSYDYLESEEAKSCFLLCSMFPEDDTIELGDLIYYMVVLHKFDDLESMEDARDRVRNAVDMLTSSCLLLNNRWEGCTKMHDVVRDVALLIATKGENKYMVKASKGLKEWLPLPTDSGLKSTEASCRAGISKLPDYEVHLPSLEIFLVNGNDRLEMVSDEFIEGMKEVKVLDMMICNIKRLPQSMKLLTKLRMLYLSYNGSLHEISILGEMRDLQILCLNYTGITKIPQEIGRLVNLRRLDVNKGVNLINVAPGVISRIQRLEELCIDFSRMSEGVSDCIVEVMKLSNLTYLELTVNSIDLIPEGFNAENLKGFNIIIGGTYLTNHLSRTASNYYSKHYLHIGNDCIVIPLLKRLKKLIEVSRPITFLKGIENLNNIMPTLCDEGFNKLKDIKMYSSPNVSCLVDDSTMCDGDEGETKEKFFKELKHLLLDELNKLEVLWKCPDEYISLNNLVTFKISRCNKLERVFRVSVAQGLVNLKKLKIHNCGVLEEVIWSGGGDDESGIVIVFPSLTNISLRRLASLKRFYSGNFIINYPSLADVKIYQCVSMKIWGPGIHETPNLKTLRLNDVQVLEDGPCAINEAVAKYHDALEKKKASSP